MNTAARRCADAIRRVGSQAVLVREGLREAFPASVQLQRVAEMDAGPLGPGRVRYYTLYAPPEGAGSRMEAGDTVLFHGQGYTVCHVEDMMLAGEVVYRQATLRGQVPQE